MNPADHSEGVRLSKQVMAQVGCSRSEAEALIAAGRITVDGVVCEDPPRRVTPQQVVDILGQGPARRTPAVTLIWHKPPGTTHADAPRMLTEAHHHAADRSGLQLLRKHLQGLACVAPLERAASGLVVFTQQAGVARRLVDEGAGIEHEVLAEVRGTVDPQALQRLQTQAVLDGRAMIAAKVSINQTLPQATRLRIALKGYSAGHVLALCEQAGLELTALRRMRIGRLPLRDLPEGQWRFLLGYERF
jgi:23S rRNA pseudouridine2604 synthase